MGKDVGPWQGVAYNLAMKFAKCGRIMLESGAHQGGEVVIDFLRQSVDPHDLAKRRESYIAVCRHYLKQMEGHYQATLRHAQITMWLTEKGHAHYVVRLETSVPPVGVEGTLIHLKGQSYEWQSRPVRIGDKNAPGAQDTHHPGADAMSAEANAADSALPEHGYGGYAWVSGPAQEKKKQS